MAKTRKNTKTKKVVKIPKTVAADARLRKKPKYKSFKLHKRVKHHEKPLLSVRQIVMKALKLLGQNKKSIFFFSIVYGIGFMLFVRGIVNPINIDDLRATIDPTGATGSASFGGNIIVFSELLGTLSAGVSGSQGIYQVLLLVMSALSLIWLFRQQQAGNKVTYKQALYRGMYPLVPFMLLFYLLLLELLPAIIGNFLYSAVISNGIAVGAVEQFIWLLFYLVSLLFSFYLVSSSIMSLFIVTLPEMTPMIALRKAKELVTFRRFAVFRKTTFLIVFSAAVFFVTVLPLLFVSAIAAQIMLFVMSILIIPFCVAYLFVLYRELL